MTEQTRRPPVVLVVDDEPSLVAAYSKVLESRGFAPVPAHTSQEALRLLHDGLRPESILLDLRMPGANGLDCLRALRAQANCARIPVAVMTADPHVDDHTEQAVEALGAILCYKPANLEQIVSLARRMLKTNTPEAREDGTIDREAERFRECPRCGSENMEPTLVTSFGSYCHCRSCGHSWHDDSLRPYGEVS